MGLYKLYSCNVEIQYKSCFLSKAMFFTILTAFLNIVLPFFIAYRSRGFWLKSHSYYEQPTVHFTFDYLLVGETEDPSQPIVCGNYDFGNQESCAELQVDEQDYNRDGTNDVLNLKFVLNIPSNRVLTSLVLVMGLDFQLKTVCPLHMQGLVVITRDFPVPPSGFIYHGDLKLYQMAHLPCHNNIIDTKYNNSLFRDQNKHGDFVDLILEEYYNREVIVKAQTLHSRNQNGHTGQMQIKAWLRVPETKILYTPSLLQEFKWAWPQYLSIVVVFYWIFNKIKKFVFNNRLLMAWEVITWKRT